MAATTIDGASCAMRIPDAQTDLALCSRGVAPTRALRAVAFNGFLGVAVGDNGCVFATVDGGSEWVLCRRGAERLRAVAVDPSGLTWVAGWRTTLLRWEPATGYWCQLGRSLQTRFESVLQLANGMVLVAGSRGTILRTLDGGASWR